MKQHNQQAFNQRTLTQHGSERSFCPEISNCSRSTYISERESEHLQLGANSHQNSKKFALIMTDQVLQFLLRILSDHFGNFHIQFH